MKLAKRILALVLVLSMVLPTFSALAETNTLTLPTAMKVIEEEAFYGDTSIDKVLLPEGILEIQNKAFANSSLKEINLPSTVTTIADDAFDSPEKVSVTAEPGSYAYDWAVRLGYIKPAALEITRVNCSVDGRIPLGKTVLWAVTAEGDGDVQYEFVLSRRNREVARQNFSSKNYYRYTFTNTGDYSLSISCQDEGGNSVNTMSEHTVYSDELSITEILAQCKTLWDF